LNTIKMDLAEIEWNCVEWISLAQYTVPKNDIMNFEFCKILEFLSADLPKMLISRKIVRLVVNTAEWSNDNFS
jgi:hypothetical protein